MDYDNKLLRARLDVIESVLLNLVPNDQLNRVRDELSRKYEIALMTAKQPDELTPQSQVAKSYRDGRDREAEAARVEAYMSLCKKFGVDI